MRGRPEIEYEWSGYRYRFAGVGAHGDTAFDAIDQAGLEAICADLLTLD